MDVIIALVISTIGNLFGDMDFFALFSLISISLDLYKSWLNNTNDKTALQ